MRCKQCLEKFGTSRNPSHEEAVWIAAYLKQNLFHSRMIRPVVAGGGLSG